MVQSGKYGIAVDRKEIKNDFKAKERERALTKLYSRMNNNFKQRIFMADGQLLQAQRKIK